MNLRNTTNIQTWKRLCSLLANLLYFFWMAFHFFLPELHLYNLVSGKVNIHKYTCTAHNCAGPGQFKESFSQPKHSSLPPSLVQGVSAQYYALKFITK